MRLQGILAGLVLYHRGVTVWANSDLARIMARITRQRRKRDENESMRSAYGRGVGFFVGEPCESTCNSILFHIYCNTSSNRCECRDDYPVYINNRRCVKAAKLGEKCDFTESCAYSDVNSICHKDGDCRCDDGYLSKDSADLVDRVCMEKPGSILDNSDFTTMISVLAGLMIFTALFCLVLRLFSRARFNRPAGRLANASAPSVVLSGMERAPSVVSSRRPSRSSTSTLEQGYVPDVFNKKNISCSNRDHCCNGDSLARIHYLHEDDKCYNHRNMYECNKTQNDVKNNYGRNCIVALPENCESCNRRNMYGCSKTEENNAVKKNEGRNCK